MAVTNGLVPARFLMIIAHMVLVIVIFWSREENIRACLPRFYTEEEYKTKDTQLIIGLSVSLGLFVLELGGFMAGLSMFVPSQAMISTVCHGGGAFALSLYLLDTWCWKTYWWVFAWCSALPGLVELLCIVGVASMGKAIHLD